MTRFCAVFGCANKSNRESDKKYFGFPGVRDRRGRDLPEGVKQRECWIKAIKRADLTEEKIKNASVCSDHFLTGWPATSNDSSNPDYAPSKKLGYVSSRPMKAFYKINRSLKMWAPRHVSMLIGLYKENPCLYKPKHPWFKNRHARSKALEKIREELRKIDLDVEIPVIKSKFNNLRTNFWAQYKKYHSSVKSGMGSEEIDKPSLWYYNQIEFLAENSVFFKNSETIFLQETADSGEVLTDENDEYDAKGKSPTLIYLGKDSLLNNQDDDGINERPGKKIKFHDYQILSEPRATTSCNSSIYSRSPSCGSDAPATVTSTVQSVVPKSSIQIFSEFIGSQLEHLKCDENILLETQQDITNIIWAARKKVCSKNRST